jgi:hypothetical protein
MRRDKNSHCPLWLLAAVVALAVVCGLDRTRWAAADDWPTWRRDPQRTAASAQSLPPNMTLQWMRQLPRRAPMFDNDPPARADEGHEPVVLGKTLYVGLDANNALLALDTETGKEKWRSYAAAPIRFAPVAWRDSVFAGADDGCLYAFAAADGACAGKCAAPPPNVGPSATTGSRRYGPSAVAPCWSTA